MTLQVKNLDTPDEKRSFEHGDIRLVEIRGATVARATFGPGWIWSEDVEPLAGTGSCQVEHTGYVVSGRMHVRMDDGRESDLGPGDAHAVGAGHDAWVVGDEPCVVVDFAAVPAAVGKGRVAACPCGVEFRIAGDEALDHLVAAVQEHAAASHGQAVEADHVLSELRTL